MPAPSPPPPPSALPVYHADYLRTAHDVITDHHAVSVYLAAEVDARLDELHIRLATLTPNDGIEGRPTLLNAYGRQCYDAGREAALAASDQMVIEARTAEKRAVDRLRAARVEHLAVKEKLLAEVARLSRALTDDTARNPSRVDGVPSDRPLGSTASGT